MPGRRADTEGCRERQRKEPDHADVDTASLITAEHSGGFYPFFTIMTTYIFLLLFRVCRSRFGELLFFCSLIFNLLHRLGEVKTKYKMSVGNVSGVSADII